MAEQIEVASWRAMAKGDRILYEGRVWIVDEVKQGPQGFDLLAHPETHEGPAS